MKLKSLAQLREIAMSLPSCTVAVAGADDSNILDALCTAHQTGLCNAILIGNPENIKKTADIHELDISSFAVEAAGTAEEAAEKAALLVSHGHADALMKGLIESSVFIRAAVRREHGLRRENTILSSVAVFEVPELQRFLLLTDAGFVPFPTLEEKKKLLSNAITAAGILGIKVPKIALLAAIETVNPKIPSTVEAAQLEALGKEGFFGDCDIAGPISLDLAVSPESALHKRYTHPVAGKADILLAPNIEAANILFKSLVHIARLSSGGMVIGAKCPVIFTSRGDSTETKLNTIALAIYEAAKKKTGEYVDE